MLLKGIYLSQFWSGLFPTNSTYFITPSFVVVQCWCFRVRDFSRFFPSPHFHGSLWISAKAPKILNFPLTPPIPPLLVLLLLASSLPSQIRDFTRFFAWDEHSTSCHQRSEWAKIAFQIVEMAGKIHHSGLKGSWKALTYLLLNSKDHVMR